MQRRYNTISDNLYGEQHSDRRRTTAGSVEYGLPRTVRRLPGHCRHPGRQSIYCLCRPETQAALCNRRLVEMG